MIISTRTTLTLADDVAAAIEQLRRERGLEVSDVVNELIRGALASQRQPREPFRQTSYDLGAHLNLDNIAEALEILDGVTANECFSTQTSSFGLPWQTLSAFLRMVTHPRASRRPLDARTAWRQIAPGWAAWISNPGRDYPRILGDLVTTHDIRGNLVPDAAP